MVSFSTKTNRWDVGGPDLTPDPPQPPPVVVDPPLYGTALTTVRYRREIGFIENNELPVLFLQWDDLALAHAQGSRMLASPPAPSSLSLSLSLSLSSRVVALFSVVANRFPLLHRHPGNLDPRTPFCASYQSCRRGRRLLTVLLLHIVAQ